MNKTEFMSELGYKIVYSMKDIEASLKGIETTFFKTEKFPCWVKRIKSEYYDYNEDILIISFDSIDCTDEEIEIFNEAKKTEDDFTTVMKKYISNNLSVYLERRGDWGGMKYLTVDIKLEGKSITKSELNI